MKKLLVFVLLIILALACIYIFIPNQVTVAEAATAESNPQAAYRHLQDSSNWMAWWPSKDVSEAGTGLTYNQSTITLSRTMFNAFEMTVQHKGTVAPSLLRIIPGGPASTRLEWSAIIRTGNNPVQRINRYLHARQIQENLKTLTNALKTYLENPQHVYGINITEQIVQDTLLVFTSKVSDHEPFVEDIYKQIDRLKAHISTLGVQQTNPPMQHVARISSGYEAMVAIPVNRRISDQGDIAFKQMVAGRILVAEVKGGLATVKNAFRELENYVRDHHKVPPAIPFESLVTDRMQETDTSKWVTRLYYPIL
jgi:DNA gyrase inhibitor GyrI